MESDPDPIAQRGKRYGDEIAPGAVACSNQGTISMDEFKSMVGRPRERIDDIVETGGERVLGGEPVVDEQKRAARAGCKRACKSIEIVERSHDPAAAMNIKDEALGLRCRTIEARLEAPLRVGTDSAVASTWAGPVPSAAQLAAS